MKNPQITQENVHLLLPPKVAQLAARLSQEGLATTMQEALDMVYLSPVYAKLEQERSKYWWLGVNALYDELVEQL